MGYPHLVKRCGDCGKTRPVADFYASGTRGRDGFCKDCRRRRDRERASKRPKMDPARLRRLKLKRNYGVTPEWYAAKVAEQNGCCAMCGRACGELHIDHDHHTGIVRDLLCMSCNTRLGVVEDDQFVLVAQDYLERHGFVATSHVGPR